MSKIFPMEGKKVSSKSVEYSSDVTPLKNLLHLSGGNMSRAAVGVGYDNSTLGSWLKAGSLPLRGFNAVIGALALRGFAPEGMVLMTEDEHKRLVESLDHANATAKDLRAKLKAAEKAPATTPGVMPQAVPKPQFLTVNVQRDMKGVVELKLAEANGRIYRAEFLGTKSKDRGVLTVIVDNNKVDSFLRSLKAAVGDAVQIGVG